MSWLDQNRGSKFNFLFRLDETQGRNYIYFFFLISDTPLDLGWTEIKTITI